MKALFYLVCILIVSIHVLPAQTTTSTKKVHKFLKPYNDSLWQKNEIGFGISAPVLSNAFVRNKKDIVDCNIQYKRLVSPNNIIRLGLNYFHSNYGNTYGVPSGFISTSNQFINSDSFKQLSTEYNNINNGYLNIGYEHLFGKKRIKFILGSDITLGYSNVATSKTYDYYSINIDTLSQNTYQFTYSNIEVWQEQNGYFVSRKDMTQNTTHSFLIGIKPFVGLRANLSNRLAFNFYTAFHLNYTDNFSSDRNSRSSRLNMDIHGIVSEVSLFYRF